MPVPPRPGGPVPPRVPPRSEALSPYFASRARTFPPLQRVWQLFECARAIFDASSCCLPPRDSESCPDGGCAHVMRPGPWCGAGRGSARAVRHEVRRLAQAGPDRLEFAGQGGTVPADSRNRPGRPGSHARPAARSKPAGHSESITGGSGELRLLQWEGLDALLNRGVFYCGDSDAVRT
jgi:hypothetical protein